MGIIKRLMCPHLSWAKGCKITSRSNFNTYGRDGVKAPFTCRDCGKVKRFSMVNPPINHFNK